MFFMNILSRVAQNWLQIYSLILTLQIQQDIND
jgi:hypothetical protein